jgi:4a-hydroxytetrahydrobiopterin dehydratase
MNALSESEIQTRLSSLPEWIVINGLLARTFNCSSYAEGVAFALKVAMLAEKMDHHPDSLEIGWKKVRVAFVTHSAGGLTALDFDAAVKVSSLVAG